jgi:STE24 endopeptidase
MTSTIRYHRFSRVLVLVGLFLQLGLLFLFARLGWSRSFSQHVLRLTRNYYLGVLLYWSTICLVLTLVLAGVSACSYVLERTYQLTKQSYSSWFGDYSKRRLINWAITSIGVAWFYCAVRNSPERWYIWFWLAIVLFHIGVLLLIDSVFLPFFYKVTPLESGEVFERLSQLAGRAGISHPKFAVLQVGEKTPRSNAAVTGIAGRYRILITDTVLKTFTTEEIEAVVAHEIGHQVKHHTSTRVLLLALLNFLPLLMAYPLLPEFISDLSNFGYLPDLFIVWWVVSQYVLILFGLFARTQEYAADRFSWQLTGNIPAFISMLRKLAAQNQMMTHKRVSTSHPAVDSRIAAAEKFLQHQPAVVSTSASP